MTWKAGTVVLGCPILVFLQRNRKEEKCKEIQGTWRGKQEWCSAALYICVEEKEVCNLSLTSLCFPPHSTLALPGQLGAQAAHVSIAQVSPVSLLRGDYNPGMEKAAAPRRDCPAQPHIFPWFPLETLPSQCCPWHFSRTGVDPSAYFSGMVPRWMGLTRAVSGDGRMSLVSDSQHPP